MRETGIVTGFDEVPDAELLARHLRGDHAAFGELVHRHRDRLWAVALRTLGDPDDAADALQDALVSAFRKAAGFRGQAAVTTWLHRIVVNACIDLTRRRAARPVVTVAEGAVLDAADRSRTATAPGEDPEQVLDVLDALRRLPTEQRAALVLVDMQGYSVQEAAAILDVAPGTVKSRCARGRARLVPYLAHLRNQAPAGRVPSPRAKGGDTP